MRESFAQQPACQMPRVTRPHPLYRLALCELAENGVYPVTKPATQGARFGIRVKLVGGVRDQMLNTHTRQLVLRVLGEW